VSDYFEVRVEIAAGTWPALETLFENLGAAAVTQTGGDTQVFAEPGIPAADAWTRFAVEALFASHHDAAVITQALRKLLGADVDIDVRPLDDRAWADAWKAGWHPLSFAGGLCVCPSWCEPPPDARHVIRLDPGQAFGTGTHESTALCLDWLAGSAPLAGKVVIDYGTGSGVLALAACLLGAAGVVAVDIDSEAIATARANVDANGCAGLIEVGDPTLTDGRSTDLLVANILAEPLLALAPRFAELVRPRGWIALAGLLANQAEGVTAAYRTDFALERAGQRGDWVLLAGQRRASAG
jgi:ribosomal protein L11 methyltransferase